MKLRSASKGVSEPSFKGRFTISYSWLLAAVLCLFSVGAHSQASSLAVTTHHNDNSRTGQNLQETALTPQNVNVQTFGRVFSLAVQGQVYAQPLYLPRVSIPGKGVHNVVYVATEHDQLYAFDADTQGSPLWQVSFIHPPQVVPVSYQDVGGCEDLTPEIGITSTPVIDWPSGTLYVVVRTKENGTFYQRLHALDVTTGSEKLGPIIISARVKGKGAGNVGGYITFDPLRQNQRAALLLSQGKVFIGWASHCDAGPYHGWVMAYDAKTLQQSAVFNSDPDGSAAGVWMSGAGLAADAAGSVYFATGNGTFDADLGGKDYGDSQLKLHFDSNGNLIVQDYFTPSDQLYLDRKDLDLGSGGMLLLPRQNSNHPNLLVQAGKEGTVYLIDRSDMGQYGGTDRVVQELGSAVGGIFGMPAYWNNFVYFAGKDDTLKAFALNNGVLSTSPVAVGPEKIGFSTPSVSALGNRNAIVWIVQQHAPSAILRAYNATNITQELYNSEQNPQRDRPGMAVKFAVPVIANGKVFVGTQNEVDVYGLMR